MSSFNFLSHNLKNTSLVDPLSQEQFTSSAKAIIESHIQNELAQYLKDSVVKINLNFNKFQNIWEADVIIDSTRGMKASRKKDKNIQILLRDIVDDLKDQCELINHDQKSEIFLFDKQQEYDHFTETLASVSHKSEQKLKILVVEDDPTAQLILEKSLKTLNCQADSFNDPEEAIKALVSKPYDLIVLDWCLPYMSGFDFLKQADSELSLNGLHKSYKAIPLVICSSKNSNEINLPLVSNFLFCQYWDKQLPFSTVISSIENTITSARKFKTKVA